MSKIRVLVVCYGFGYGGIQTFILNCLEHINRNKIQIDIYAFGTIESPFTEKIKNLGANIYFEPENNVRKIRRFVSQLEKFMTDHGPYDVVHANCNLISAWVLLAAKRVGISIRLSHSHSTSHFSKSIVQNVYSYFRRFLIDVLATKKLACGQLAGETMYGKKTKFVIVNNGIDVDRFIQYNPHTSADLRKFLQIPDGARVYANVSRLTPEKNHLFAIEIFREIHKKDSSAVFIYGGIIPKEASVEEELKLKIKEYCLDENVRFVGPLMNIEYLYHLSDVWIFCSKFEGLPFCPIELQASGIPCLVSDVITKEIDLGLGIIDFISLDESPSYWAQKAIMKKKIKLDYNSVKAAFKEHNFDIKESVKLLEEIYGII